MEKLRKSVLIKEQEVVVLKEVEEELRGKLVRLECAPPAHEIESQVVGV